MSFPKAKIQRFNEIKDCTPSPAKYNLPNQEKIKLGIISKTGLYVKKGGSPPSSEAGSAQSTPCFQTPTVPKRKKILGLSFKHGKTPGKLTEQEELRDKIVECNNKDLYIKDLIEQTEEITERLNDLSREHSCLKSEKNECEGALAALKKRNEEESMRRAKEYNGISNDLKEVNKELKMIRQKCEDMKNDNLVELSKLLEYIGILKKSYDEMVAASREEAEGRVLEALKKEEELRKKHKEAMEVLKMQHAAEICSRNEEIEAHKEEINVLKKEVGELKSVKKGLEQKLNESDAKNILLEENFKDINLLTEIHLDEKIKEVEATWMKKLKEKEKESEDILKECQAISEYNIIQSEIEKNQLKKILEDKEEWFKELESKYEKLKVDITNLKTEKHAYELSIVTFQDTIEVLTRRLMNSDRDVVQLKEELEKDEEKILNYERKCTELISQLNEVQTANEELEMQYESTSKLMQNEVRNVEKKLLKKVEELKNLIRDNELQGGACKELAEEQQNLLMEAQETIAVAAEHFEMKRIEFEEEVMMYKKRLSEETEEAAEIRKRYIEKSGKYDELAQQFEQILQELDKAKGRIEELERLILPYQQQLETYQNELKVLNEEKCNLAAEAKEMSLKYAEILGHQNHQQKIKHVKDLKVKQSELFQKNIDLEAKNYKLGKTVEKLMKEIEDLRKTGKKMKIGVENKENLGSPKCLKGTQSPAPLKDKN